MIEKAFEVKNTNFWYALNGAEDGFDAIIFDVKEPRDGADITVFSNTINSTLTPFDNGTTNVSQPAIKDFAYKYFFI
ncbi:hypothetical protein, partial [Salmonella enterica]|uniref:hypothetical protein n=1 Tax=Salmonella enterica TaxID=28901 RepID=UPI0020C52467